MAEPGGTAIELRTMEDALGVRAFAKLDASDAIIFQ
jgi:hypothetical protein